jgi:hypothetical protein
VNRPVSSILVILVAALLLGLWLGFSQGLREEVLGPQSSAPLAMGPRDCAPAREACIARLDEMPVELRFDRSPRPLEPFVSVVRLGGEDARARSIVLSFQMQGMDMGLNRFALERQAAGHWRGEVTLPLCSTGRRDWLVDVIIEGERPQAVRFGFVLGGED